MEQGFKFVHTPLQNSTVCFSKPHVSMFTAAKVIGARNSLNCSFFRMALKDFGISLTGEKGTNDTNISTVNPWTKDFNYTSSPNLTASMEDHKLQDQTRWLPILIAVPVVLVIGVFIVKKRKWFHEKTMGLIGVITYSHVC